MQIEPLGDNTEPYILDDTPDVLSFGRRCQLDGYGFLWEAFSSEPYFIAPGYDDYRKSS